MDDDAQLTQLTAELAWLRRLSRALLGDADDVAHDTWIVAATRPPQDDRPLRPWLHRVARNVTRMGARAASRRQARERAVAELAAPVATPEELVHRVELQRLVAGEVLALAEPYRSTVLLHYFEELSCTEIARRLEIPDGTVRRRLKVALDELRGRLAERDPRSQRGLAWLGVLAGIRAPARTTSITAGMILMKKLVVAIAIAILAVLVVWWVRHDPSPDATNRAAQAAAGSALHIPATLPGDRALPPWFATRGAESKRIAGRVVFEGAPVAGASVTLHHILTRAGVSPARELRTGHDGRFDFGTHPPREYELVATAPGKTAAIVRIELADPLLKPASHELELTLSACNSSITGTVFDASGGTIARAQIRREDLVGVDADAQGAYSLCLPYGGGDVTFAADGYGKLQLTIDVQGASRQDVVLVPETVIAGQVIDEASRPVPDAHVAVFPQEWARDRAAKGTTVSGPDGRFRIAGLVPGRYRALAFADGSVSVPVEALAEVGAANTELMLRVASQGRLRGTVVSGGKPVAGAQVVAMASASSVRSATAISQADGTFVLEHVPVGDLRFTAAPYRVTAPATFTLATAAERDALMIEVEKLATIRGRVTRLGQPV
ncbi:MAG TPA: sigma-70 family RNA polymerase sigma factor, partial [Kofleriaceae bacterium]